MGFPSSFFIIKLNNILFLQIVLQDQYNIVWFGTKRMERLAKISSFRRF